MKVEETMSRTVICLNQDQNLREAQECMSLFDFHHIAILDNEKVVGMISDRDVLRWSSYDGTELDVPELPLKDVMNSPVTTCQENNRISYIALLMLENKIDALPILAENGSLKGMITKTDLIELLVHTSDEAIAKNLPFEFKLFQYTKQAMHPFKENT